MGGDMYMPDLSPYIYHVPTGLPGVLPVGWLGGGHEFPTGNVGFLVRHRIQRLFKHPVLLCAGLHACELCPVYCDCAMGNGEVWLEAPDGVIYAAPTLLAHYVERHHYLPPPEFIDAVRRGRPLTERECMERIAAHRSLLETDAKPEDLLVPYYEVRLMWRSDSFEDLVGFHAAVPHVPRRSWVGLRDFGFYCLAQTHDPSELFQDMCAKCDRAHVAAPYGYRYRRAYLREEERVVIP